MKNTYIVIAAYNEGESIKKVISGLRKEHYTNIVIVDDGSHDVTFKIIKNEKVHALRHIINRGQGAALKTGIDYALKKGADIIVTFDADGQHNPKEIKQMIQPIIKDEADVTLGSRFLGQATNIPWIKKMVLKLGIIFTFLFSGVRLTDTHNGFRAFSREAAQKIEINHDRMAHASEIIDEIAKKGIVYKEIPVTIQYSDYSKAKGQSSLNSIKIAIKLILRKLMS